LNDQLLRLSAPMGDLNHPRFQNGGKNDESMETFLFTLKNPYGLDPIRF
jgi:hypothetical protein